jgi:hypothetical protein
MRQCHKEIKKIDNGKKFTDAKCSARGLEGKTRFGSIAKERNGALAVDAVLNDRGGLLQRRASSSCQLWASLVGGRDHRADEEIHG